MRPKVGFATAVVAVLVLCAPVHGQSIQGTPDDTGGVFLFSAGGDAGTCQSPQGAAAAQPTDEIVSAAINFDLLEFVGDQGAEVDSFTAGSPEGASDVDTTLAEVTEGLSAIDDFGVIGGSQDDASNFDAGTGGSVSVGLRAISGVRDEMIIRPDGVLATGTLGPSGAGNAQQADAALDGFEIFIFEDAELSGMTIRLTSPTNDISISLADRQIDPNTEAGADDTLIAIDLDSLDGFDGTFIDTITITDDGTVMSNSPCPIQGETSIEIDAIVVRAAATATLIQVTKTASPTSVAAPGGMVTFTVRVDNSSTVDSVTVETMTDNVHGNLAGQGSCSVPQTVAAGAFYECSFAAFVAGSPGDSETDAINVSGTDDDGDPVSGGDNATVIVTGIAMTKSAAPTTVVAPGGTVTFSVQIDNPSLIDLTIDTLTDDVHGNLDGQGTCSVPQTVAAGGSYGCSFDAFVGGPAGSNETDVVTASGNDVDGNSIGGSDDAVVSIVAPTATDTPTPTETVEAAETETPVPTPTDTPTPTPTRTPIFPDGSLIVSKARLRMDDSDKRDNGKAIVQFLVNDNDTNGDLKTSLMAGIINVEVRDSGLFTAIFGISGCIEKNSGIIRCKSADKRISAVFKPSDQGPNVFNARVKVRKLSDAETGPTQPVGPEVDVTLVQSSLGRRDLVGNLNPCSASGTKTLKCREK